MLDMNIRMEEEQYINLLKDILNSSYEEKPNRTGVSCKYVHGVIMKFTLEKDGTKVFPLLTTKKMNYRSIISELLWFLRGDTNSKILEADNNFIWSENGSRQFLDSRGLYNREIGDLGPIYGFQWRYWGAEYIENRSRDKRGGTNIGIDQIAGVIESIKTDPYSRRHIVTAWNPAQLDEMALPPCHCMFQFMVRPLNGVPHWLDCMLFQRSADVPLGIPFNIASYSLLTHIVAAYTDLHAGTFIHSISDAHIYTNQITAVQRQLSRSLYEFPSIEFPLKCIDEYTVDDFSINGYKHHAAIKIKFTA